jgi:hypothetical protein
VQRTGIFPSLYLIIKGEAFPRFGPYDLRFLPKSFVNAFFWTVLPSHQNTYYINWHSTGSFGSLLFFLHRVRFHMARARSRQRPEADVADQLECAGAAHHIPAQQRRSPRVNAGVGGSRNLQGRGRTQLAASTSREQKKESGASS